MRDHLAAGLVNSASNASKVGLIPLLVFKRNREEPLAVRWSDLLALLSKDHRWENLAAVRAARLEEVTGATD